MAFNWEWAYMSESPVDAVIIRVGKMFSEAIRTIVSQFCTLINYSWPKFLCGVKEKEDFYKVK